MLNSSKYCIKDNFFYHNSKFFPYLCISLVSATSMSEETDEKGIR